MLEYIVKNSEEQVKIFYLYIIDNEKWLQILEEWHMYFLYQDRIHEAHPREAYNLSSVSVAKVPEACLILEYMNIV